MKAHLLTIVATAALTSAGLAQHARTGKSEYYWNNTWEWHYQLEHEFNAQGLEVQRTNSQVSLIDSSLFLVAITRQAYSASGRLIWRTTRSIDMFTQQLSIGDSVAFLYDAQDSLVSTTSFALGGGAWAPVARSTYWRNALGAMDSILVDTNAAGTWELAARMLLTLNAQGWIAQIRYDSLVNNGWHTTAELAITYDTDGRPVLTELTDPTPSPNEGTRQQYGYDAQGHLDSLVMSTKLPGGAWHSYSCAGYDPAGDGLLHLRSYYKLDTLSEDWMHNARITYDPATTIREHWTALLRAFPNPATDRVALPDLGAGVAVDLIGPDGRLIPGRRTDVRGELDIHDLAPGLYVARVIMKDGVLATTTFLKH